MRSKFILFGLLLILTTSCSTNIHDKDLNRSFIKSFYKLDVKCTNEVAQLLTPYELENDSFKISDIYSLEVDFEPNLYSQEELAYNYFIGIKFEPDSFDLLILCINVNIGAISTCQVLGNENLIINNMIYLFSDLSSLGSINCLGLNKSLVEHSKGNKVRFSHLVWASKIYGNWQPYFPEENKFSNPIFNNTWTFKSKNGFVITNENYDTLLIDKFELIGGTIKLTETESVFEIVTRTKNKILIKEAASQKYIFLNPLCI